MSGDNKNLFIVDDGLQSSSITSTLEQQGGLRRPRSNSDDFISQMPDEVLVTILSLLPIKEAAVTSSLSTRWRFLWSGLIQLNFDGSEALDKIYKNRNLYDLERDKYVNQVNNVITSYNRPIVQDFRIHFSLQESDKGVIDEWLHFAVNKKVEFLQLHLSDKYRSANIFRKNYNFPLRLFQTTLLSMPTSNGVLVELVSLKKLVLKNVLMKEAILEEFLKNSPHLETISIHYPKYLTHIHVGERALNLKHFEVVDSKSFRAINLSNFDLESFTYKGPEVDLRLSHLSKLKKLELHMEQQERPRELNDNVFGQISSCASSLQSLSFTIYSPKKNFELDFFPELPNLKTLRLTVGGNKYNYLLHLASILNACPNLHTFAIKPLWTAPIITLRKARDATNLQKQLKHVEILGYYGRRCDLKLVSYIIHTAVALKKIIIDTRFQDYHMLCSNARAFSINKIAARSSVELRLVPILPQGVEYVIL